MRRNLDRGERQRYLGQDFLPHFERGQQIAQVRVKVLNAHNIRKRRAGLGAEPFGSSNDLVRLALDGRVQIGLARVGLRSSDDALLVDRHQTGKEEKIARLHGAWDASIARESLASNDRLTN